MFSMVPIGSGGSVRAFRFGVKPACSPEKDTGWTLWESDTGIVCWG